MGLRVIQYYSWLISVYNTIQYYSRKLLLIGNFISVYNTIQYYSRKLLLIGNFIPCIILNSILFTEAFVDWKLHSALNSSWCLQGNDGQAQLEVLLLFLPTLPGIAFHIPLRQKIWVSFLSFLCIYVFHMIYDKAPPFEGELLGVHPFGVN